MICAWPSIDSGRSTTANGRTVRWPTIRHRSSRHPKSMEMWKAKAASHISNTRLRLAILARKPRPEDSGYRGMRRTVRVSGQICGEVPASNFVCYHLKEIVAPLHFSIDVAFRQARLLPGLHLSPLVYGQRRNRPPSRETSWTDSLRRQSLRQPATFNQRHAQPAIAAKGELTGFLLIARRTASSNRYARRSQGWAQKILWLSLPRINILEEILEPGGFIGWCSVSGPWMEATGQPSWLVEERRPKIGTHDNLTGILRVV